MATSGEGAAEGGRRTNIPMAILLGFFILAVAAVVITVIVVNHTQKIEVVTPTTPTTASVTQDLNACQVDGAVISTAMAVFETQNPALTPTRANLVSDADGGPYLQSWANSTAYKYILTASNGGPIVAFTGPSSCEQANVQ
jgi:hypothetical protein